MPKPKSEVTYASLERQALHDLAAMTLASPDAPSAHVAAARARLLQPPLPTGAQVDELVSGLDARACADLLDVTADMRARQAKRVAIDVHDTAGESADASDDGDDAVH